MSARLLVLTFVFLFICSRESIFAQSKTITIDRSLPKSLEEKVPGVLSSNDNAGVFLDERLGFTLFLKELKPQQMILAQIRKTEVLMAVKSAAEKRSNHLDKLVTDSIGEWSGLSVDERRAMIVKWTKEDDEYLERLQSALEELLTPSQRDALAKLYITENGELSACDPILCSWVGLSDAQAEQFRNRTKGSTKYLLEKRGLSPGVKMSPEVEDEYLRLNSLRWEGIPANKIKKILVASSVMFEDEELADYVDRVGDFSQKKKNALLKYVPAFRRTTESSGR